MSSRESLHERRRRLSPEKQALLERRLQTVASRRSSATSIPRFEDRADFPLSFGQERIWFLQQLEPGNVVYNRPSHFRLTGTLAPEVLEQCLREIVRRHEALRACFPSNEGRPTLRIVSKPRVDLPRIDLSDLPPAEREIRALDTLIEEEARQFDLETGPLFRAKLLRLSEADHILAFTLHHIVFDGWSEGILRRELIESYAAFSAGQPSPLSELPVQYGDYAVWQRQWLQGEKLDQQVAYWKAQLAGAPSVLELPTDFPRPAEQSYRGARQSVTLDRQLSLDLALLSRREGVTPFMTLLAAFQVVLLRYSGQEDVSVGAPIAGRSRTELEGLIGFFVNTLVLRSDLSGNPTFRELLGRVREVTLGAYSHQDLPFEKLVEELHPARSTSHSPLFQVMFVLQNATGSAPERAGLTVSPLAVESGTAKFDLTLSMRETADGLRGTLEYATDLFTAETIERLAGHFVVLLRGIVADPNRRIGELPLLTERERHRLLVEWNDTAEEYPRDKCVQQLFEEQVERTPESVAVVFEERSLTYRELNRQANRLAHHLIEMGVGPEAMVGLCVERSPQMIVGLLAILKAGGAYVPLDPEYPRERLAFVLEDIASPVIVTQRALRDRLPPSGAHVVYLDEGDEARSDADPHCQATADNLAYVIYTSGSTGNPKGVMITHGGLANYLHWCLKTYPADGSWGAPIHSSFAFDLAVTSLFVPLLTGQSLVLVDEASRSASLIDTLLDRPDGSFFKGTPTHLTLLNAELPREAMSNRVRALIIGGEQLLAEQVAPWRRHAARTAIFNEYGPTETVVGCCIYRVGPDSPVSGAIPIGRPIANTQAYVLDSHGEPVPVGVPGELHIGGAGVARGYLNRPELTSERFVPDTFGAVPGARLYCTGDLVRWRPDGSLEFLERMDHQAKLRGFRIELGEIETVLSQHPQIGQAAVLLREDRPGDKCLAAYVVPGLSQPNPTAADLRQYLQERLPAYMVPAAFVVLVALPLNSNGKVDRKALPVPEIDRSGLEQTRIGPRTPVEELLLGIWGNVLGTDRIGIHDDFFELGGHSLLAMRVVARLRHLFAVDLPVRILFDASTIAGLAQRIESMQRAGLTDQSLPLCRVARDGDLPLSFAQERLWFLDRFESTSSVYNVCSAMLLCGPLNALALMQSLREVVRRHEILQTAVVTRDGMPRQLVDSRSGISFDIDDMRHLPDRERPALKERWLAVERDRPFDLETGSLVRARLLRLGDEEHVLAMTFHHIVFDGWSEGVFWRELSALYEAFSSGRPSPLPDLAVQYGDYAAWQRQWLQGEVLDRQVEYWKGRLAGAPSLLELPTDFPRPAEQSYRGARQAMALDRELSRSLAELSRREGVTPFMTLLAAFDVLLFRYSGQEDVSVGAPIAGRNRTELEGLIGFFVNTLVLRSDLRGNPTFRELLGRVREVTLGAYSHQDLPFEKLVEELQPARSTSHSPLFQVMLVLQNATGTVPGIAGLTVVPLAVEGGTSKFDLTLSLRETEEGLQGIIEYATDLFAAETIERLAGHFEVLLRGIVADPNRRIGELPLLTEGERHRQLVEWNATEADYPRDRCVHELFEEQVERTPESVAVVFEARSLTYRELNRQANRLAHRLIEMGVGPETLVGLCVERSPEMIVGLMAVLKAGGAYLPLDPASPGQRLRFIAEDAQIAVVLTRKSHVDCFESHTTRVITFDSDGWSSTDWCPDNPTNRACSTNLAYVIYTSGSTGIPKGVEIEHKSLVNLVRWHQRTYRVTTADRATQIAGLTFDATVWELWPYLTAGACVYLIDDETRLSPDHILVWLADRGITICFLPTPLAETVLSVPRPPNLELRCLLTGGDRLHDWAPADLPFELVNHYGPTENTVVSTRAVLGVMIDGRSPPIGRPIDNVQAYVLDSHGNPSPVGVPGELHVGGVGVARGYRNHPELTAEKFVPNPFQDRCGPRLYRTGDSVRWLADGTLEFLGRLDHQVKLRGFRIELGEIEAVLAQEPQVQQSVVLLREDRPGDQRLVAYVVPRDAETKPVDAYLRQRVQAKLPDYMVPSAFVVLQALPLTPNGKVNRSVLPAPEVDRADLAMAWDAPRTPTEESLAAIWSEVLGVGRVGIHDNFFELGGHSLLAVQLFARIEARLGRRLPLHALFKGATIADLAALLTAPVHESDDSAIVAIRPEGTKPPLFVVHSSTGSLLFWRRFLPHFSKDQPVYGLRPRNPNSSAQSQRDSHGQAVSIESLAADYVEQLAASFPNDAFRFAGYSFGGPLAYEMARQMRAMGRRVAFVGIVDTPASRRPRTWTQRLKLFPTFTRNLPSWVTDAVLTRTPRDVLRLFQNTIHKVSVRIVGRKWSVWCRPNIRRKLPAHLRSISLSLRTVLERYRPEPYPGRVTLVRARAQPIFRIRTFDLGWGTLASQVDVKVITGCHHHALVREPHVRRVARLLQTALDEAE